jgi:hypothetical protein
MPSGTTSVHQTYTRYIVAKEFLLPAKRSGYEVFYFLTGWSDDGIVVVCSRIENVCFKWYEAVVRSQFVHILMRPTQSHVEHTGPGVEAFREAQGVNGTATLARVCRDVILIEAKARLVIDRPAIGRRVNYDTP